VSVLTPSVDCVVDAKALVAECPVWCEREQALYWADIYRCQLNRYDPATGKNHFWPLPAPLGSFALRQSGGVLLAMNTGLHFFAPQSGAIEPLVDPEAAIPDSRLNDGKCDRAGNFWVGSMKDPIEPMRASSTIYRFTPDRRIEKKIPGRIVSNGIAFSPDNKTMYHAETHRSVRSVFVSDHDPADGRLSNTRVFVDTKDMAARPDGAAIDVDGCYWMAGIDGGALLRFTPAGKLDLTVKLPVEWPTMPAFGGRDFDTIYVTSLRRPTVAPDDPAPDGGVFALRVPGVKGLPEPKFAG
jgi:L-arabinonolactonase